MLVAAGVAHRWIKARMAEDEDGASMPSPSGAKKRRAHTKPKPPRAKVTIPALPDVEVVHDVDTDEFESVVIKAEGNWFIFFLHQSCGACQVDAAC